MAITGIPISNRSEIGNSLSAINNAFLDLDQRISNVSGGGGTFSNGITATNATFTTSVSAPIYYGTFSGDGSGLTGIQGGGSSDSSLALSGGSIYGPLVVGDTFSVASTAVVPVLLADSLKANYDPYYTSVILLNRNTGTIGSLPPNNSTATFSVSGNTGTAGLSSKYVKFNTSSLYFNSPGYLASSSGNTNKTIKTTFATTVDLDSTSLGSANFTLEFWVYVGAYPDTTQGANSSYSTSRCASLVNTLRSDQSTTNAFCLGLRGDGTLIFHHVTSGSVSTSLSIPLKTWTHVVLQRSSSVVQISINGSAFTTIVAGVGLQCPENAIYTGGSPYLPGVFAGDEYGFTDTAFSEFRLTVGTRYASSPFLVPQTSFPYKQNNTIDSSTGFTINNTIVASAISVNNTLEVLGNTNLIGSPLLGNTTLANASYSTWKKVAMSSDGRVQTVVTTNSSINVSTNYGVTWNRYGLTKTWTGITMSSDGVRQLACSSGSNNYIYRSLDSGSTWVVLSSLAGGASWQDITMTPTGSAAVAAPYGGYLKYTTTLSAWSDLTTGGSKPWNGVTMSQDGTRITGVAALDSIYVSTDTGATWQQRGPIGGKNWTTVKMSLDGRVQAAGAAGVGEPLYVSKDYGTTWSPRSITGTQWNQISISPDGKYILASTNTALYGSNDSGDTWTTLIASKSVQGIAMSSDGTRWTASVNNDRLYVFVTSSGNLAVTGNSSVTGNSTATTLSALQGIATVGYVSIGTTGFVPTTAYKLDVYGSGNNRIAGSYTSFSSMTPTTLSATAQRAGSVSFNQILIGQNDGGLFLGRTSIKELPISVQENLIGTTWTSSRGPSGTWAYLAASSDGRVLIGAMSGPGYIYVSTDYGFTWTQKTSSGTNTWYGVAISQDGKHMMAGATGGTYVSNNFGSTFSYNTTPKATGGVTCSSDGRVMYSADNITVYVSKDFGSTWLALVVAGYVTAPVIYSISTTSDGKHVAIATSFGIAGGGTPIGAISIDYGETWTWQAIGSIANCNKIAMSQDGKTLVVHSGSQNKIAISTDYGYTWGVFGAPANGLAFTSILVTPDGKYGYAIVGNTLYVLTVASSSWTTQTLPVSGSSSLTVFSDGRGLAFAGTGTSNIYFSYAPCFLTSNLTLSGNLITTGTTTLSTTTLVGTLSSNNAIKALSFEGDGTKLTKTLVTKTASYTLSSLSDANNTIVFDNTSSAEFGVPSSSILNFPISTEMTLIQANTNTVTVSAGAITLLSPSNKITLGGQGAIARIVKIATDVWVLDGTLV